ncbi:hypothetical protein LCGC14_1401900, partial [marine sediment metagenome]
ALFDDPVTVRLTILVAIMIAISLPLNLGIHKNVKKMTTPGLQGESTGHDQRGC